MWKLALLHGTALHGTGHPALAPGNGDTSGSRSGSINGGDGTSRDGSSKAPRVQACQAY